MQALSQAFKKASSQSPNGTSVALPPAPLQVSISIPGKLILSPFLLLDIRINKAIISITSHEYVPFLSSRIKISRLEGVKVLLFGS